MFEVLGISEESVDLDRLGAYDSITAAVISARSAATGGHYCVVLLRKDGVHVKGWKREGDGKIVPLPA